MEIGIPKLEPRMEVRKLEPRIGFPAKLKPRNGIPPKLEPRIGIPQNGA